MLVNDSDDWTPTASLDEFGKDDEVGEDDDVILVCAAEILSAKQGEAANYSRLLPRLTLFDPTSRDRTVESSISQSRCLDRALEQSASLGAGRQIDLLNINRIEASSLFREVTGAYTFDSALNALECDLTNILGSGMEARGSQEGRINGP